MRFCPFSRPIFALLLLAAAGTAGCGEGRETDVARPDDEAFATLGALRYDYVREASTNLRRIDHIRVVETLQLDPDGDTTAAERFVVQYRNGQGRVLDSTLTGGFRAGFIARAFGPGPDHTPDTATFRTLIPQDAAFLSARNRDAFAYRLTTADSLPAVEVVVRDPEELETDLRRALLVFEPDSRQVVRIELDSRERSWLLESESAARLSLRRVSGSHWLPEQFSIAEERKAPLQRGYRVSKTESYEPEG